jgi:hypothetical protein
MKRRMLIWLTMLALLAQGWTSAAMASAVTLPAKAETIAMSAGMEHCAMHAHDEARSAPSLAEKAGDCCGAAPACHCVSACGAVALLPVLFALSPPPASSPRSASANAGFGAVLAAHPFRPPIL